MRDAEGVPKGNLALKGKPLGLRIWKRIVKLLLPTMTRFVFAMLLLAAQAALGVVAWEKPIQDFRCNPASGSVEARFVFKNVGDSAVRISRVTSSCGCTVAQFDRRQYGPGENGELRAVFTFGGRSGSQRKLINAEFSDGTKQTLEMNVLIEQPVVMSPSFLFWRVGEAASGKVIRLTAGAGEPIRIRSVSSTSPKITVNMAVERMGESYVITATPRDTSEQTSATLIIETDFPATAPKKYSAHIRIK